MTTFYLDYENGSDSNDGSTWALAWKTITSGATAARIAPGDTIRIAKSPAPVSIGNATWTNLSKTVTLASAQTANIELCESVWTVVSSDVYGITTDTGSKEGTNCVRVRWNAQTPVSNALQCYQATGTLDLSSYQKISFWIKPAVGYPQTNSLKLCLCSDTAGETVVDTFTLPSLTPCYLWAPITVTRDGGGNLGSSIQSIALYTGSDASSLNNIYVYFDNIIACTTDGLNLQHLISKNSAEQGGSEGWYGIKSINGTTVVLDNDTSSSASAGRGYYGTSETVTTYMRKTIKTTLASAQTTSVQAIQESGSSGSLITYSGGWNTSDTTQDGETFFDGLNCWGYGLVLSSKSYISMEHISAIRYYRGYSLTSSSYNVLDIPHANNNTEAGVFLQTCGANTITIGNANNNGSYGYYPNNNSDGNTVTIGNINNNNSYGMYLYTSCRCLYVSIGSLSNNTHGIYFFASSHSNRFTSITAINNNSSYGMYFTGSNYNIFDSIGTMTTSSGSYGLYIALGASGNIFKGYTSSGYACGIYNSGTNYLYNVTIEESSEVSSQSQCNCRIFSHNHDNTAGNHWIFTDGGTINAQATTRHTASGIAWTLTPGSTRDSAYPLDFSVAKVACAANAQVTVKIWMIKSHATNIAGKLVCRGGQIAGVTNDVTATKASDTDWEELTIQFTPTEAGVVEIEVWGYYVAGTGTVTVDDMTISQA